MKRAFLYIIICLSIILQAADADLLASEEGPSHFAFLLLDRINEARKNPIQTIQEFEMDIERILLDFPDLENILLEGLPPLFFNQELFNTARRHTMDMLERGYFSSVSPDGDTPEERILDAGYLPLYWGETLEFAGFKNFLSPEEAVEIMFENMLRDELDPSLAGKRNILNPKLIDVGIHIDAGSFEFNETATNLYIATVDFAAPGQGKIRADLLEMINALRAAPKVEIGRIYDAVPEIYPETMSGLSETLYPLTVDEILQNLSEHHLDQMISSLFFDNTPPDGLDPIEAAAGQGYNAAQISQTIGALVTDKYLGLGEAAEMLFENLIKASLENSQSRTSKAILNPEIEDIGLSVDFLALPQPGGDILHIYALVLDIAAQTSVFSGGKEQSLCEFVVWTD